MSNSKDEIIDEIKEQIKKSGSDFSDWYVGVSKDAKNSLFNTHKVKEKDKWWIYRTALSSLEARRAVYYCINVLGTDGSLGEGNETTNMVYAYKKEDCTDP